MTIILLIVTILLVISTTITISSTSTDHHNAFRLCFPRALCSGASPSWGAPTPPGGPALSNGPLVCWRATLACSPPMKRRRPRQRRELRVKCVCMRVHVVPHPPDNSLSPFSCKILNPTPTHVGWPLLLISPTRRAHSRFGQISPTSHTLALFSFPSIINAINHPLFTPSSFFS
jgi:hypothetical protein